MSVLMNHLASLLQSLGGNLFDIYDYDYVFSFTCRFSQSLLETSWHDGLVRTSRSYHFQYKMVKNERRNVEMVECDIIFTALISNLYETLQNGLDDTHSCSPDILIKDVIFN